MPTVESQQLAQRVAFGSALRKLRLDRDLSQEALAHTAGLDRSYVGGVERGERNVALDNIFRLAHALDAAPSELLVAAEAILRRRSL